VAVSKEGRAMSKERRPPLARAHFTAKSRPTLTPSTDVYETFEGTIESVEWGRSTYTILRVPDRIATIWAAAKVRRVEGEISEHPVNLALTKAPVVRGIFLWAGKSLIKRLGVKPGDRLEIRLRPAVDDQVDTPEDVALALRKSGASAVWEALSAGKRRGLLYSIELAKTAPTRSKRINALVTIVMEQTPPTLEMSPRLTHKLGEPARRGGSGRTRR
jgi:hypothetical protein